MTTIRLAGLAVSWVLCGGVAAMAEGAPAQAVALDIPALPLNDALKQLAQQVGFQVVFYSAESEGLKAPKLSGSYTAEGALKELLAGTGLSYEFLNGNTVAIRSKGTGEGKATASGIYGGDGSAVRVAQADASQVDTSSAATESSASGETSGELEEIVVTAQKRLERLQDVPVPVTALAGDDLIEKGELRVTDYITKVPGLSVQPQQLGVSQISIRGITTGTLTNPTVGIVVDDVPYGSSTFLGGGYLQPDIDPSDLSRIEVLRGPQGTLYGVATLGGLIKYATVDPSVEALMGRVRVGMADVRNGDGVSYQVRGSVNIPLNDRAALMVSGLRRREAGFVDNIRTGAAGDNTAVTNGGRLAVLWRPADDFSLKFSAVIQDLNADGTGNVDPRLGDLKRSAVAGVVLNNRIEVYSATMTAKLGAVELTSVSAYTHNSIHTADDFTLPFFVGTAQTNFGVSGVLVNLWNDVSKFSQEMRIAAPLTSRLDWLVGAFGTYENSTNLQTVDATDPGTGAMAGNELHNTYPTTYAEYAVFTDFTYHFTDRFDVQLGGRESANRQSYSVIREGLVAPTLYRLPAPIVSPAAYPRDSAFTYLATPRFKVSRDLMLYARLASGYRAGGANTNSSLVQLPNYAPDKTQNYELGAKGSLFRRALSYDVSLYYIDWRDIQVQAFDPATSRTVLSNGSRAKSQGAELGLEARPLKGLTAMGWFSWSDAKLTEDLPAGGGIAGLSGDRLPVSPRVSGSLSLNQAFSIGNHFTGFVGGSFAYVGERLGPFTAPTIGAGPLPRQIFPSYTKFDFSSGIRHDDWSLTAYVNNVTDKRGVLSGDPVRPPQVYVTQPRTFGLSFAKDF